MTSPLSPLPRAAVAALLFVAAIGVAAQQPAAHHRPHAQHKPYKSRARAPARPAPPLSPEEQARIEFDRIVYEHEKTRINFDRPQPLLRAVVVLRVTLDPQDRWHAEVFRDNPEQPEMTRVALETVEHLPAPAELSPPTLERLHTEGLIEAWLFQNNGRFALKSLAKPQRGL
ncbi:MAG: hypothetical protein KGL18_18360 [Burkholderiales bacterium]|nr:hypothetical protein [Burkholderiales bacterium]MDE1928067.1 hypothetical protein [Burkholderiales bacterium]MDE2157721.1 hypothetical protein [Burkholderiales bacterium]MDE2504931.1 hypothetical protein [Burkholderiales bacterium]